MAETDLTKSRLQAFMLAGLMFEKQLERERKARLDVQEALLHLSAKCGESFDEMEKGGSPSLAVLNDAISKLNDAVAAHNEVVR